MYMTVILVFLSILAVMGTLKNKKMHNKPGLLIGGTFTALLVLVTLIAVYDEIVGIQ
ncbi:hypothetical protein [Marininema mesophilum]|uniref:hypothetical protein n=1 Tax=Marininema mesophilum TaxID=1048340 RepID=UPI0015A6AC25|nr:hypothetical protein [Marininema mesophilum]